jgi:hypothetical protein
MEAWWAEILAGSRRDQISFDYVHTRSGEPLAIIPGNAWTNDDLVRRPHDRNLRRRSLQRALEGADCNVLSFPKSGRTWIRYFLRSYFRLAYGLDGDLGFARTKFTPQISFKHEYMDVFQDGPGRPSILLPAEIKAKPLVVVTRDPRDVAVSYFYQKSRREGVWNGELATFLDSPIYGVVRQAQFVNELLDIYGVHPGPKIWMKYEELHQRPLKHFRRLTHFLMGVRVNEAAVQSAVEQSSFTAMQAVETAGVTPTGEPLSRLGGHGDDPQAMKVRQGKVGGWREAGVDLAVWEAYARQPDVARLLERMKLN